MEGGEGRVALLRDEAKDDGEEVGLTRRTWEESKKLWRIVGPAIFSRVVMYGMVVITQAFAGHLGDLELASISIANNVVVGFNFGLLDPGVAHMRVAKKVLRYLQRTKEFMLTYRQGGELQVIGYTDSDFAGCKDTLKSTSGYVFLMAGGAISWKSSKQSIVTDSTMHAEYVACYEATKHALWLKNFVGGLGIVDSIQKPLPIFCDNEAVCQHVKNEKITRRNKHLDIKYMLVCEKVKGEVVEIPHVRTELMVADPLTKRLAPKVFQSHVTRMGLMESLYQ